MVDKKQVTESKLKEALKRLIAGEPIRTKSTGRITLNKINKEAGLGNSYIHKFEEFVKYAKDIINKHNEAKDRAIDGELTLSQVELSEREKWRIDLQREKRLKEQYRKQRDDARKAQVELHKLNGTLTFRLYELQEEIQRYKVVSIQNAKS